MIGVAQTCGDGSKEVGDAALGLGLYLKKLGKLAEALKYYEEVRRTFVSSTWGLVSSTH